MKMTRNVFTIVDLNKWFEEKTLKVNKEYQREKGLWPPNARSFFIDTILNEYPFPKITIRQTINLKTQKSIREIVDGQQRMMTINDFINNRLTLSKVSNLYKEKKFSDLDENTQNKFLSYEVSVDTIIGATEEDIIGVFRRINSYTLPLNEPEKRHATYQGEFKWFIKDMIELYSPLFEKCNILSVREIARMKDADLMTELCQVLIDGVIGRRSKALDNLYKDYDNEFKDKNIIEKKLKETLDFIKIDLNPLCDSQVLQSYSFYSLFSALVYNKWGISNINENDINGFKVIKTYTKDTNIAIQNILELFTAVEKKDLSGKFGEFVQANIATTHSVKNRTLRLKWLIAALQNKL